MFLGFAGVLTWQVASEVSERVSLPIGVLVVVLVLGAYAVADLCGWVDTLRDHKSGVLTNISFVGITAAGYAPSNK